MWLTDTGEMFKLVFIEVWLFVTVLLLFFSMLGGKKKNGFSWEKKRGANVGMVIVAIISLIALGIYIGVYLYDRNTLKF
ncbi:MAG: hypothetical protein SOZ13_12940 [Enterococcus avium]|uniref:Uncharacterized protein n=1 Tax=Enterococcus avium TaxID=33945 RepID=A0ABD5F5Q9_ENTAV|nr:hypothetical protein [Enterococcus avium]MDT2472427.1 hypothetical protein [Enterococcus avium]MDT2472439.1 hypothetical protein [Enterococcus avium]MDT2513541.1 hypothetical protein [Enterococcus avium]MDT2513553.1 hypothetical protein [Enterococcus avium]MDY4025981.1 hypothetical protein [Enterococcus avium]